MAIKRDFEEYKNETLKWANELSAKSENFLKEIEKNLLSHDLDVVIALLNAPEAKEYRNNERLVVIAMLAEIYLEEKDGNISPTVFDKCYNVDEYNDLFRRAKHALWRVEFAYGDNEEERFLNLIKKEELSPLFLIYLIKTSAMDRVLDAYRIAGILRKMQKDVGALKLLGYANDIQSNDEYILCEMADIFVKYNKMDVAMQYVSQIKDSTGVVNEYLKKWEKMYAGK